VQPENANSPIVFTPSKIITSIKFLQPSNTCNPTSSIKPGIVIEVIPELAKVVSPRLVIELGNISTSDNESKPANS